MKSPLHPSSSLVQPLKSRFRNSRFGKLFIGLLSVACFAIHSAQATTLYWDTNGTGTAGSGAATGTWGTSVFWTTDSTGANVGSPTLTATTVQADDLFFSAGTTGTTGTVTVSSTQLAHSITFDDPVALTLNGGTAINLGSATAGSGIFLTANGATTISTGIILNSAATAESFSNSGTSLLTIGAVTGAASSGTQTITVGSSGSGGITLNGIIADVSGSASKVALTINNTGSGTTTLSGVNTFTGGVNVSSGTLLVGGTATSAGGNVTGSATGTGNVTFANGTSLSSASGATWNASTITLNGTLNLIGGNRLNVGFKTLELGNATRTVNVNSKSLSVTGNALNNNAESTGLWSWETNTLTGGSTPVIQNGTLDLETTSFSGSNYATFFLRSTDYSNANVTVGQNVILGLAGNQGSN